MIENLLFMIVVSQLYRQYFFLSALFKFPGCRSYPLLWTLHAITLCFHLLPAYDRLLFLKAHPVTKQLWLASFRLGSNDQREYYFQRQGSSNLCGPCALNSACSQELFSAQELDNIADTLWLELFLEGGVASELHPLRCWDGKLPSTCSLQYICMLTEGKFCYYFQTHLHF